MEPLTIAGALMGALINKVLPEIFLTGMLVLLLSFTAYETLVKSVKMYKKETAAMKAAGFNPDGSKVSELTVLVAQDENENEAHERLLDEKDNEEFEQVELETNKLQVELDAILEQERTTPVMNIKILAALFVVVLTINLLKGGGAFTSPLGIRCGSPGFWYSNVVMIVWILVITIWCRNYLVNKHERKLACGFSFFEGDMKWDRRSTIVYPVICAAAGYVGRLPRSKLI
jgi:uncharacterized membrane protein YqhA